MVHVDGLVSRHGKARIDGQNFSVVPSRTCVCVAKVGNAFWPKQILANQVVMVVLKILARMQPVMLRPSTPEMGRPGML